MRRVSLLGATGSIGDSALDVVARHPDRYAVEALAANRNVAKLAGLCRRFRPAIAAMLDPDAALALERDLGGAGLPTRVLAGPQGILEAATCAGADTVLAAIVGAAGLAPTLAAARCGKRVMIANKEALARMNEILTEAVDVLKVQGTPTTYLNGERFDQAADYEALDKKLQELLAKKPN
jgi:1-deoxy-D-xylulose-5-phosphate reductoisomerase